MTAADVLSAYESRLSVCQKGYVHARKYQIAAKTLLVISVSLAVSLFSMWRLLPHWCPPLTLPIVAEAAWLFARFSRTATQMYRLRLFHQRAVQRIRGEWSGNGSAGCEFSNANHVYARDLDVFGEGSLFELLCIARTGVGRRGLAQYLLEVPPVEETRARQEAVRELRPRTTLRERVSLLGRSESSESRWETFTEWLELPLVPFHLALRVLISITSALVPALIVAGMVGLCPGTTAAKCLLPILVFNAAVGLRFRRRVNRMKASLHVLSTETRVLREGLRILERECFHSTKLRQLVAQTSNGSASIRKLELLLNSIYQINKEWFYLPSLVLMLGTQLSMAIEDWRARHREALRDWLAAWAEFEALNCLACYGYENPGNVFPDFAEGELRFEARALGHPLLPRETCVLNDIELNGGSRFYMISGSNMSGKSTLLRAIGLNAVLALAGAPVRASALRLSPVKVCASISVVDSLLSGKSKFLAEVDRLRLTIQASERMPVLFLIDEILSGTNSQDRRTAAEAVVRTLISRRAVGAISTHDLKLSELGEDGGLRGANVHMGSRNGIDPMDFDYCLKPGVTRERSPLAIARMAGVPV